MKRRQINRLFAAVAAGCLAVSASAVDVRIAYDRPDGRYEVGETATFTVSVFERKGVLLTNGVFRARFDNFGSEVVVSNTVFDLSAANPFVFRGKLDHPGFLRIVLNAPSVKGFRGPYMESVAYSPEKLRPAAERPADFDAFWKASVAKYDVEIKPDFEMVLDEALTNDRWTSKGAWEVWRLSFTIPGGRKMHGFLTKPKGAEGKLPVRVSFPGAGYGPWSQKPMFPHGHIGLLLTVYPFPPDSALRKKADYNAMYKTWKDKWGVNASAAGIAGSREDYFYYGIILGGNRAVDWLAARDDVDATRITYSGKSQGGGLGLALVAINDKISKAAIKAPALTDFLGYKAGYESGWPKLLETFPADKRDEIAKNAAYFDGVNFAQSIKIPIRVYCGYGDVTCPPPTTWAMFNMLASSDKKMFAETSTPHWKTSGLEGVMDAWLDTPADADE